MTEYHDAHSKGCSGVLRTNIFRVAFLVMQESVLSRVSDLQHWALNMGCTQFVGVLGASLGSNYCSLTQVMGQAGHFRGFAISHYMPTGPIEDACQYYGHLDRPI